jgi:hypothetical protein
VHWSEGTPHPRSRASRNPFTPHEGGKRDKQGVRAGCEAPSRGGRSTSATCRRFEGEGSPPPGCFRPFEVTSRGHARGSTPLGDPAGGSSTAFLTLLGVTRAA